MLGRTPDSIKAVRPLKDGVIADFSATRAMLKNLIAKVCDRYKVSRPRVVIGVPSGIAYMSPVNLKFFKLQILLS